MKKIYSLGLLVLVLMLVVAVTAACGTKETTETTAAEVTETTVAEVTETTTGGVGTEIGVYFEDQGNNVVKITDVPAPGLAFPMSTGGDYPAVMEAFDAAGASLGLLETTTGLLDYSSVADKVAKIVVTTSGGVPFEYVVPAAGGGVGTEIGVYFEDQGNNVVKITDVPAPGLAFPMSTGGDYPAVMEAFDAAGASLGLLETTTGLLDYSSVADKVAKIVVTTSGGVPFEYVVPAK